MAVAYQIAVIGDWESVMGFRALGLDTYPVTSVDEAKEKVRELAKVIGYGVDMALQPGLEAEDLEALLA